MLLNFQKNWQETVEFSLRSGTMEIIIFFFILFIACAICIRDLYLGMMHHHHQFILHIMHLICRIKDLFNN